MKLTLENFRSHEAATLTFPDVGFVKLDGRSGTGKSNIFKALMWSLYGKQNNVVRYGATKCSVNADLGDLRVLRGKGPTTFEANGITGETGQAHICTALGMNELEFEVSSYIAQDQANSFIHCKPAEQMDLLQRLAFSSDNPDELKERVKGLFDIADGEAKRLSGEIALTTNTLQIKTQQLTDLRAQLREPETAEIDTADAQNQLNILTKEGAKINGEMLATEKTLKDPVRERLVKAKSYLEDAAVKQQEYANWFTSNPDMPFTQELEREEARTLVFHLTGQVREFTDMQTRIADRNGCARKANTYGDQLQDLVAELQPDTVLDHAADLYDLSGKYIKAKKDLDAASGTTECLDDPTDTLTAAKAAHALHEAAYNEWVGVQAIRTQKKKEALDININIDKANLLITSHTHLEAVDVLTSRLEQLRNQRQNIEIQINSLNTDLKNAKAITEMWQTYRRNQVNIIKLEQNISEVESALAAQETKAKTIGTRCAKLKRFLELIQKAALSALEARIEEINVRAEHWLDVLFSGTLQATIETEKEAKNGNVSHKIHLAIHENGTKVEKKEELSGGQQSRLALAFQLALSDMYRSPVLLLDESLRGCDAETSKICLEAIRQISERKLVLMVEHHIPDSQFDKVVSI